MSARKKVAYPRPRLVTVHAWKKSLRLHAGGGRRRVRRVRRAGGEL